MAKINLLPWRDELRKQKQQDFIASIVAGLAVTALIFGLVYMYIEGMKEHQQQRNTMIKNEINVVNGKIKEIKDIETKKSKLLTKIEVIQKLQQSRPEIVHLFDELAKSTPEGIFLTKFKQTGNALALTGKAQSNARVSAYMRGVESSPWLKTPILKVIKGNDKLKNGELSDFQMSAQQGEKGSDKKEDKQ